MDYREYGKLVWDSEKIQIYRSSDDDYYRLYLVDKEDGKLLNELISGMGGLRIYYKNDYKVWATKMIEKNIKARQKEASYFKDRVDNQEYLIDYYLKIKRTL